GFRVITFTEYVPDLLAGPPLLLLRHDIDYSLQPALKIANLERHHGIRATYFIRLHSPFYSPLSPSGRDAVRLLVEQGHEIGYHFDYDFLNDAIESRSVSRFMGDVSALEAISGTTIRAVAAHDPVRQPSPPGLPPPMYLDAYDGPFMTEFKY